MTDLDLEAAARRLCALLEVDADATVCRGHPKHPTLAISVPVWQDYAAAIKWHLQIDAAIKASHTPSQTTEGEDNG